MKEPNDEKELFDLYEGLKQEKNETQAKIPDILNTKVLNQLLASSLEDKICLTKETVWGFFKVIFVFVFFLI